MFDILYQDEYLVAMDKPPGLLVHRTRKAKELRTYALQGLKFQIGQYVYPIHRLDLGTSGVLLFALDNETASRVSLQFVERSVEKVYWAITRGYTPEEGEVDKPLRKDPLLEERPALTRYRRLATAALPIPIARYPEARYSLVEARPLTGRFHQIRRHLSRINHPIIGDAKHGDYVHNQLFRDYLDTPGMMLTARKLTFTHPYSGERLSIEAPMGQPLRQGCELLGWGF